MVFHEHISRSKKSVSYATILHFLASVSRETSVLSIVQSASEKTYEERFAKAFGAQAGPGILVFILVISVRKDNDNEEKGMNCFPN